MSGLRLAVTFVATICLTQALDYSDLESTRMTCPGRDSCQNIPNPRFDERNCACDQSCTTYDDCCVDASRQPSRTRNRTPNVFTCMPFWWDMYKGVYTVSKCHANWRDVEGMQQKCEGNDDYRDPLVSTPVTDTGVDVTYRNRFCAECNFAQPSRLLPWDLVLNCDDRLNVSGEYVASHLVYEEDVRKWGVFQGEGRERQFYKCDVDFELPEALNNHVRFCRAVTVAGCPRGYRMASIKRMCAAYTAVVIRGSDTYKNPHCAKCHGVEANSITCNRSIVGRKKLPMSFALLLDINRSDGDVVGVSRVAVPDCPSGEKYDPFFKKCRKLVCALPGYTIQNGRCVRS